MAAPERKTFLLRVDPKLWVELEAWAGQELRSVNGQIEFVLREAVRKRKRTASLESNDEADSEKS
ncbi:Arc family DNA binding domain-containing protein [Ereboglobus luteus]|uniref:Arc family DNA binding domain-containing protein n=1 Tax=Ereboglobus luteus TaxID=1796921 RepID=A0A2U8DZH7_9BACT|nr:Arc family DNA binding domain-containing protein [Ereboglobus luteus]